MNIETFWNKYINEDVIEDFDVVYNFFSTEFSAEIYKGYDLDGFLLEFKDDYEMKKEFDKIIKFFDLIRDKHFKLYLKNFEYLDNFLIDYHLNKGDDKALVSVFENFRKNPLKDVDRYSQYFHSLLFFGKMEMLDDLIIKNYKILSDAKEEFNSDDILYVMAITKFYLEVEKMLIKNSFDRVKIQEIISPYNFILEEDTFLAIDEGLINSNYKTEKINKETFDDPRIGITVIEFNFYKYMKKRGISFPLSRYLWHNMAKYWMKFENSMNNIKDDVSWTFFEIQTDSFRIRIATIVNDGLYSNTTGVVATIWGSVYIYDFLRENNLINLETYIMFKRSCNIAKGEVINQEIGELWRCSFIHNWNKPDGLTNEEYNEEKKIFDKSYNISYDDRKIIMEIISEELKNIGELEMYILAAEEVEIDYPSFENDYFEIDKPIRVEKKTGRNEPCPCGSGKKYKKCCG